MSLVGGGADVDAPDHSGLVPLFIAIRRSHIDIA